MQLVVIASLVAVLAATVNGAQETRIPIGGFLNQAIENFRHEMPCGVNGGPPLAPLKIEYLRLDSDDPQAM